MELLMTICGFDLLHHKQRNTHTNIYTHENAYTHTRTHTHIYIYICVCVCVCVCMYRTNVIYMFKCLLGDCVSKENSAYVGLTTTTLSKQLTMHFNDSSSVALHLKTHSVPKSKFQKILVENTIIIAHEIDKL